MAINIYDIINNRIQDLLQQGTIPWRKPWNAQSNYPKNLISKKKYRGINVWVLACQEYDSPYWLSFKQVQDKGGHIRKGEKATPVVFWKWINRNESDNGTTTETSNNKIPLLRYYNVFNINQAEGITQPEPEETHNQFDPIETAEQIITAMPLKPEIRHGGNRAYYSPSLDYVQLPQQHTFNTIEEYYSTTFHELSHATGHSNRLARKSILEPSYFGSHEYSKEELVAEIGAAFLCGHSGIENITLVNSAAYIQGWLKALKNDRTLLIHAAAAAQKAADYILNIKEVEAEESLTA